MSLLRILLGFECLHVNSGFELIENQRHYKVGEANINWLVRLANLSACTSAKPEKPFAPDELMEAIPIPCRAEQMVDGWF